MKEHRFRLTFEKKGPVAFVSHLDLQRLFQQAIVRAGLPVAYSQGFNPHQLLSFAFPLSIGMEAEAEYIDMEFNEDVPSEELISRLNAQLPAGIRIIAARKLLLTEKTAASLVCAAIYEAVFPKGAVSGENLDGIISGIMESTELIILKRSKKGDKETDIRPLIFRLENKSGPGTGITEMELAAGSDSGLRPDAVCALICGRAGCETRGIKYNRKRLILRQ